jgi:hypothetical protein
MVALRKARKAKSILLEDLETVTVRGTLLLQPIYFDTDGT